MQLQFAHSFVSTKNWDAFSIPAEGADRSHLHNAPDSHDMFVPLRQGQVMIDSDIAP